MTDEERDELIERVELVEDLLKIDVMRLVKQARRVEIAVMTGAYRKKDVLQLNELVVQLLRTFDRIELFYDSERVNEEMKNQSNSCGRDDGRRF